MTNSWKRRASKTWRNYQWLAWCRLGLCYELPLVILSSWYDSFSFHASLSLDSTYASFFHSLQTLYQCSIFSIPLFCLRDADTSFPPLFLPYLFWSFLSWSRFPFSMHSPMVCARWCCHINNRTCFPCIPSLDLPRNTLDSLWTLRSLSLCPTTEWTLYNSTSADSWPVVSEPLEPLIISTTRHTKHLIDYLSTHSIPGTVDCIDYPLYRTPTRLLVDAIEPLNHTRAMTDLTTGQS